jgi:hypothetical protein
VIPSLLGGQPQIDPWRQQLQQMFNGGTFGGHSGHQAFAGPSTMQAYAMSGEGRHLNPTPSANPGGSAGGAVGGATGGLPSIVGSPGGGGLSDMIRQVIEYQRQQALLNGSGGNVGVPSTPMRIPTNPTAPTRQAGGGLLGAY